MQKNKNELSTDKRRPYQQMSDKDRVAVGMSTTNFSQDPYLIHKIQDRLLKIEGEGLIAMSIRNQAKQDIKLCVEEIGAMMEVHMKTLLRVVDSETLCMIKSYLSAK